MAKEGGHRVEKEAEVAANPQAKEAEEVDAAARGEATTSKLATVMTTASPNAASDHTR